MKYDTKNFRFRMAMRLTGVMGLSALSFFAMGQSASGSLQKPDPAQKVVTLETSCGQCNFGLKGKGCDLAVRINGKAYYVSGTGINDHGDAHDDQGFCNAIRKAEVQGQLVKNRYVVTYFRLLPVSSPER